MRYIFVSLDITGLPRPAEAPAKRAGQNKKILFFYFSLTACYNKYMNINLKTKGFDLTGAIEIYLREKLDSLDKILPEDESISADVELMRTTNHHNKGNIYRAEINLAVPGRLIRAVAEEWDLRVAIDAAKDELQREIAGKKERSQSLYKKGARLFKKILRGE